MILAIDTSQMTYSIASSDWEHEWDDVNITLFDQLRQHNLENITTILINIGPGRFSGLRSGIAFAKGFARGKNIQIVPINRFELIASKIHDKEFSIALDARKSQVFLQKFPNPKGIQLIERSALSQYRHLYGNIEPCKIIETNAKSLLEYYNTFAPKAHNITDINPLYIRESV